MAGPFDILGAALGGDSEKSYEEGRALGAKTEEALANARQRVMENDARARGQANLEAAGVAPNQARLMADAVTAGKNYGDPIEAMLKNQEFGFRATAGDPNTDITNANAALRGVATGPVDRYQKIGAGADDRFDAAGIQPLGDMAGSEGGGSSAAMQALRAFNFIDPTGHVVPGKEADAYDLYRDTTRNVDAGGVPLQTTNNPFHRVGPQVVAPAPVVAHNAAEIASGKEQGQQQGLAAVKLPEALSELDQMQANLRRLTSKPGFDSIYGARQGTDVGQAITQFASQDAADADADRKQLAANAFIISIVKNKGQGQLSNAEGLKFTDAFTRATNPRLSPAEARQAWGEVDSYIDTIKQRLKQSAAPLNGAQAAPAAPGGSTQIGSDAEYDALPPGAEFIAPDGSHRRKP